MDVEEIYGVLMEQLIATINRYDPNYSDKVRQVAEVIDHEFSKRRQFTVADINRHVDFDSHRCLRMLCRRGYLESAADQSGNSGWYRSGSWPPPPEFFTNGVVGMAYYIQRWFRFNLQMWIEHRMHELEAHEGVYSWDFDNPATEKLARLDLRTNNEDGLLSADHADVVGTTSITHGCGEHTWRINGWYSTQTHEYGAICCTTVLKPHCHSALLCTMTKSRRRVLD